MKYYVILSISEVISMTSRWDQRRHLGFAQSGLQENNELENQLLRVRERELNEEWYILWRKGMR